MRFLFALILLVSCFPAFLVVSVHAQIACPAYQIPLELSSDEAIEKINACYEARQNGTANTIDEYQCPSGEFVWGDQLPLTYERLAYHVTVNLMMNEVDQITRTYMKSLMDFRNYDVLAWTEHLRSCLRTNANNPLTLEDMYAYICKFDQVQQFLNTNSHNQRIITTTQTYPQPLCNSIAERKIRAWESL